MIVVRITRHPLDAEREAELKRVFDDHIRVITDDIPYENDPVASVRALIQRVESENNDKVLAVEAQAPFPALMRLVEARHELGVMFIRAQFARDQGGRAIVVGKDEGGRDLLKFSHYEEFKRIVFETVRLEPHWR